MSATPKTARDWMACIIGSASGGFPHDQATAVIQDAMSASFAQGLAQGRREALEEAAQLLEQHAKEWDRDPCERAIAWQLNTKAGYVRALAAKEPAR